MAAVDVLMTAMRDAYDDAKAAMDTALAAIEDAQEDNDNADEARVAINHEHTVKDVLQALATMKQVLDEIGAVPT